MLPDAKAASAFLSAVTGQAITVEAVIPAVTAAAIVTISAAEEVSALEETAKAQQASGTGALIGITVGVAVLVIFVLAYLARRRYGPPRCCRQTAAAPPPMPAEPRGSSTTRQNHIATCHLQEGGGAGGDVEPGRPARPD